MKIFYGVLLALILVIASAPSHNAKDSTRNEPKVRESLIVSTDWRRNISMMTRWCCCKLATKVSTSRNIFPARNSFRSWTFQRHAVPG